MDEISQALGVLKEQGRWLASEVSEIKRDVKSLQAFKWKAMGAAAFTAFLATILVELLKK